MSAVSMIINALKPRSWDDVWSNASSQAGAPNSPEVSAANLFSKAGASGGDPLGPLLLRQDDGALSTAGSSSLSEGHAQSSGGSSASKSSALSSTSSPPSPTLIGSAGGLQINLVWDSSVASAPSGFESAIVSAATYYTTLYSNKEVINIGVGYGKINGTAMSNGALGESEALGYNLSYSMVASAMKTGASASSYAGKVNYVASFLPQLPAFLTDVPRTWFTYVRVRVSLPRTDYSARQQWAPMLSYHGLNQKRLQ